MVQTYRLAAKIDKTGQLHLAHLPFRPGDEVEVIVRRRDRIEQGNPYPFRGLPYSYDRPTDPVAEDDWEALK